MFGTNKNMDELMIQLMMSAKQMSKLSAKAKSEENAEKNKLKKVAKNMGSVSKELSKALQSMNLEKVDKIMDKFERQFSDLDVRSNMIDKSLNDTLACSTPENEVLSLMKQVADEHGLEISTILSQTASVSGSNTTVSVNNRSDEALNTRLQRIRQ